MKKYLFLILFTISLLSARADDASWKIHPTFDEEVTHVVETPSYVYFTSRKLEKNNQNDFLLSLFRYDKKGEELLPLSTSNILNGNTVRDVIYNPAKGYLAVIYKDYDIDLLYNDGSVVNIPYYAQQSLSYSKNINGLALDIEKDRLYLATDFGYVALNDKKGEVAESRIYGTPMQSFCRLGNLYVGLSGNKILTVAADSPHLSLDQFTEVSDLGTDGRLYPAGNNVAILLVGEGQEKSVKKVTASKQNLEIEDLFQGPVYNVDYTPSGLTVTTGSTIYQFDSDGKSKSLARHQNYINSAAVSDNMAEVWNGLKRKGLNSVKKTGESWSLTRDWMLPNSPAPIVSNSYINHPDLGLLVLSHGSTPSTYQIWDFSPFQLSSYRNGRWSNHSTAYTNPSRTSLLTAVNGMALDPDNRNYVYISSFHNGIARINLSNPLDIIHLSRSSDSDKANPGFAVLPDFPVTSPVYSNVTAPFFDKQGNMWMSVAYWDDQGDPNPHFYCWTAADRKVSTANDIKLPQLVEFDVPAQFSNFAMAIPLTKTGSGLIAMSLGLGDDELVLLDTNATPLDTSDDKTYKFTKFTDGDGNSIEPGRIIYLWEDPATGYVWVCHTYGVFYFIPSQVRSGNYQVYRVKVARNDGTNLADYLLEGVKVNHVSADSEGRKWFSTTGAGIICTTSDGREIIEEFTTQNSPLPDDVVYSVAYNSAANSLMISTDEGFAEYQLPVSSNSTSSTKEDVRAYPNPVRPEYNGYVTITDIPTGSFVKITDSAGNLVKELGIMSGFDILWDLSDYRLNRVRSGVYHILISPSDENSSYSTVGKILVIS